MLTATDLVTTLALTTVGEDQEEELLERLAELEETRQSCPPLDVEKARWLEGQIAHHWMTLHGYPEQFSYDALRLRYKDGGKTKEGWPVFMVLDLDQPIRTFTLRDWWDGNENRYVPRISPDLPEPVVACYDDPDLLGKLRPNKFFGPTWIRISATLDGSTPPEAEQEIQKARDSGLFENILLAIQVDEWTIERNPVPRFADPLVLGYAYERLWLISQFDPTELEQYIGEQFAWTIS